MGLEDKLPEGQLKKSGEKIAMIVAEDILLAWAKAYVAETDNPYDDAAYALIEGLIRDMIGKIDGE